MGGGFWGNRQGISIHALRGEGDTRPLDETD